MVFGGAREHRDDRILDKVLLVLGPKASLRGSLAKQGH